MRRPVFIARQSAHPTGCLGNIIGRIMASETAGDNERAISLLRIQSGESVLDVGTGHGSSLKRIAASADEVTAVGVDPSDVMLSIARLRNAQLLRSGQVRIEKAASDNLPFADASFDKAMAVHTLYFWKPAEPHLREIARVLKPGARFCLGFRPAEDSRATSMFPSTVYEFRTIAAVENLVAECGFRVLKHESDVDARKSMAWLLVHRS